MPGIRLGVDFGTSNTAAVLRWPDGRSRSLLFDGSPLLPSAVYAEPSGALVVGRDAIHSARLEPARFEPNPKRRIDDGSVLLGDREVPVAQLIAAVLIRVRDEFRRTVGEVPTEVTITCPAAWGATRRLALADAAAAAGLGQVRLVAEPVAAATYFTKVLGRDVPIGSVVVVHDFGAGTFDASVVARTSSGFEVLAVDGRDDIGGLDVDEAIIGHVARISEQHDAAAWQRLLHPSTVDERRARRLLWDDVRMAKERLSRQPAAEVTVPLLNVDIRLTREELEELARPILEQTVRVTSGVIRWARLPEGRIAGVFLVGGSSRIPLMATMLHRALGEPPVAIDQPELVVADGSLIADAGALPAKSGPAPGPHTGVMPAIRLTSEGTFEPLTPMQISGGPISGAPGPGGAVPVSGVPVSSAPMSGPPGAAYPVSGSPAAGHPVSGTPSNPPYAVGRVIVPGAHGPGTPPAGNPVAPTRPMPGIDPPTGPTGPYPPKPAADYQPPTKNYPAAQNKAPQYSPAQYQPAQQPIDVPSYDDEPRGERRSPAVRALLYLLVALLLVAVPVITGYITYKLTTGQPPLPIKLLIGYR
jgi:Hsp70 protein